MSKDVSIDDLFAEIGLWGAGFLATVTDGERVHVVALRPEVVTAVGGRALRFRSPGRTALANVGTTGRVTIAFPPHAGSNGFSLIVDGLASAAAEDGAIDVHPASAVLHRPAP